MWKSTKQLILSGGEDENSKSCILVPCIENEELRKALADGGFPALVGLKEYFVPFMRSLVSFLETDVGTRQYHLRVCNFRDPLTNRGTLTPAELAEVLLIPIKMSSFLKNDDALLAQLKQGIALLGEETDNTGDPLESMMDRAIGYGFYIFVVGVVSDSSGPQAPRAPALEDIDTKIEYVDKQGRAVKVPLTQRECMTAEGKLCRAFIDAQGRPKLVSTCNRFVRRQTELSDDELFELWSLPFNPPGDSAEASPTLEYVDCRLNCGRFQNIAHLHLKVGFLQDEFNKKYGDIVNILKGGSQETTTMDELRELMELM